MRSLIFAAMACGLLVAADNPAASRDRDALKGEWKATSFVIDGRARETAGTTVRFDREEVTVKHGDDAEPSNSYTLDPEKKTIDLELKNEGRTMKGIYEVKGKTLKICLGTESRPSKFAAEAGSGQILMTLERP